MGAGGDRLPACDLFALRSRTSRFTTVPEDLDAYIKGELPLIAAMWHGQHLMMPLARPETMDRLAVLISRHEDAGAQALAAERLGITPVRGSGGPADRDYYKGGAPAMRELLRQLESGVSVAMTADVPKRARVAGQGIVDAGQALRPADRPDRGRCRACGFSSTPGIARRSDCRSAARSSSSAISSAFRRRRRRRRWRPRGSPSSAGSTRRTGRPTPWLAQAIPARS